MTRPRLLLAGSVLLLAPLVGCSASVSTGSSDDTVGGKNLEDQVSSALEGVTGVRPTSVSCPDSLKAEEGATTGCTVTSSSGTVNAKVTTTAVDGGRVKFDVDTDGPVG